MLDFDRIRISEGIYVNKTSTSKELDIGHYWHFLNKVFKFQPNVCNRYHDLLVISMNLRDIALLNIKRVDYKRCIISGISKSEAINLMQMPIWPKKLNIIKQKKLLSREKWIK